MNCEDNEPTSFGVLKQNLIKGAWLLRSYEGMSDLLLITGNRAGMFFSDEDRINAGLSATSKDHNFLADAPPRSSGMPIASKED